MNSIQLNLETFAKNILELDIIGAGSSIESGQGKRTENAIE